MGAAGTTRSLSGEELPPRRGFFSSLNYIGSYRGTYLLNADGDGLVIVDQHASHERITFERLRLAWAGREMALQQLLIAQVVTLDSLRAATLADNLEVLGRLGYEIDPFGGGSFAIRTVPAILSRARHDLLLRDVLDELGDTGRTRRIDDAVDSVLIRMACHSSVRAGDLLHEHEVRRLYAELDSVDFGANCPHGRPVWFRLTLAELETRFERR
jgi:DNA mismatch repair protein MutL